MQILVAERSVSEDEAADAVNNAAIKLIKQGTIPKSVDGLLLTAARRQLIDDHRRRERRHRVVDEQYLEGESKGSMESLATSPDSEEPVVLLARRESDARAEARLHRSLKRLSGADRELLTAHYLDEKPLSTIEELQLVPPGTAKSRMSDARNRLRRALLGQAVKRGPAVD